MREIVHWIETELFNDEGIAHQFQHILDLGLVPLASVTIAGGHIARSLRHIRSERGDLEATLNPAFQQFPGLTWFYGGWIDQAVFTLRFVRSGPLRLIWQVAPLIDSDPIDQGGDSVLGCCDRQHQLLFLTKVSWEACAMELSLRTDSPTVRDAIDISPNAFANAS